VCKLVFFSSVGYSFLCGMRPLKCAKSSLNLVFGPMKYRKHELFEGARYPFGNAFSFCLALVLKILNKCFR
jgi:hypothetical protein